MSRFIAAANAGVSILSVYLLLGVYGHLHWWYRDARRAGLDTQQLRHDFLASADQIPIIAILLSGCAAIANVALWQSNLIPKKWGVAFACLSSICFGLCVIVRI